MRQDAKVWIAGVNISAGPTSVRVSRSRHESLSRTLRGRALRGLPYLWDGAPDLLVRWTFTLPWGDTRATDDEHFEYLSSYPSIIPVAPWHLLAEHFTGDGTTNTFYLARGIASRLITEADLPGGSQVACEDDYPVRIQTLSGSTWSTLVEDTDPPDAGKFAVGAYDTSTGRTPIVFGTIPAAGDEWRALYYPYFRAYIEAEEHAYENRGAVKPRSLTLTEGD